MKGKWALGIKPRNFTWIIKDQLAVCERPGGYGANHRRVRRQEEIIWIRENGFDVVMSLIPSPHNLHNYDELGVAWRHRPFGGSDEGARVQQAIYADLTALLDDGQRVLVHREELGDQVAGLVAGYLIHTDIVPTGPQAIQVVEQLLSRQMGPVGRELAVAALRSDRG